jgi:hypothetical protein
MTRKPIQEVQGTSRLAQSEIRTLSAVLMYLDRPTRWTWHGVPPTIFKEKALIIVPADIAGGGRPKSGPGELSERVSTLVASGGD